MSPSNAHSQTLLLPDGRRLGYAVYGAISSYTSTVLYSHGAPSSRLEAAFLSSAALNLGIHIVSIDRPGIGLSSSDPSRKILDYPADVAAVISHLSLQEEGYYLLGFSGGAAYTLACAHLLPSSQIKGVGIIAGIGPWGIAVKSISPAQRIIGNLASYMPALTEWMMDCNIGRAARAYEEDSALFQQAMRNGMRGLDEFTRTTLEKDAEAYQMFSDNIREAYSAGTRAVLDDARLLVGDWGFRLQDIQAKAGIQMWYSTDDQNCRLEMGQELADLLPGAELRQVRGQTHFTIVPNCGGEILSQLVSQEAKEDM